MAEKSKVAEPPLNEEAEESSKGAAAHGKQAVDAGSAHATCFERGECSKGCCPPERRGENGGRVLVWTQGESG